jgi:hypothetical protein
MQHLARAVRCQMLSDRIWIERDFNHGMVNQ